MLTAGREGKDSTSKCRWPKWRARPEEWRGRHGRGISAGTRAVGGNTQPAGIYRFQLVGTRNPVHRRISGRVGRDFLPGLARMGDPLAVVRLGSPFVAFARHPLPLLCPLPFVDMATPNTIHTGVN